MIRITINSSCKKEYKNYGEAQFMHSEPQYRVEIDNDGNISGYKDDIPMTFLGYSRYNSIKIQNAVEDISKEVIIVYPSQEGFRMDVMGNELKSESIKSKLFESKQKFNNKEMRIIINNLIDEKYEISSCGGIYGMDYNTEKSEKIFGYDWKLLQLELDYPERSSDADRIEMCIDFVKKYLI